MINPLLADSGYLSHNGATSRSLSPMYTSVPVMTGLMSSGATGTHFALNNSTAASSNPSLYMNSTLSDMALNLNLNHPSSSQVMRSAHGTHGTQSTLSAPMSMLPPLSPLSLPALPLDAMNPSSKCLAIFFCILCGNVLLTLYVLILFEVALQIAEL